jgi:hypothetical protein
MGKQTVFETAHEPMQAVRLANDFGEDVVVTAKLAAEDMHFNNATGVLTVEKLYQTADGRRAYSVVTAQERSRERRAYLIEERGERCLVTNGSVMLDFLTDELLLLLSMALSSEQAEAADSEYGRMFEKLAAND